METPEPLSGQRAVRAEKTRIKDKIRRRTALLDRHREDSKQRPGEPVPERNRQAEAEAERAERIAETPELGVLYLIFWPFVLAANLWRKGPGGATRELQHDQLMFRFHDLLARNPILGLVVVVGGLLLAIALAVGAVLLVVVVGESF